MRRVAGSFDPDFCLYQSRLDRVDPGELPGVSVGFADVLLVMQIFSKGLSISKGLFRCHYERA
jgi:hypothetical protein